MRSSYPIDAQADEMITATLATQLDHIRFIQRAIKRLELHIARIIDHVPNLIITVPGLGPVITAGVLAEIVDVSRLPEHKYLADCFGITWERRSTGNFVSQHTRLTKVGNPYGRYYFIRGADKTCQYSEVSKYQHQHALVLTASKPVRLVHALVTENEPYVRPRTLISPQEDRPLQQVTFAVIYPQLHRTSSPAGQMAAPVGTQKCALILAQ